LTDLKNSAMRKIIFTGQQKTINFFKSTKKKESKRNIVKGVGYLGGAGYLGQQTIRSGVPRLLGVRLESHSTSRKNAKEILKNDGWLDPNRGGTGASKAINNGDYISASKNNVHITGKHKNHKLEVEKVIRKNSAGEILSSTPTYRTETNTPIRDVVYKKVQRSMYRGLSEGLPTKNNKLSTKITKLGYSLLAGSLGIKGRSLYIGGSDEYFNKNFVPDSDDVALKSTNRIKVHSNRASATLEALKREGGGSKLKGIAKLVKANPSRALAGAGILAGGGLVTAKLGQAAYNNLTGKVKGHTRKNKSGKWSNIKSFIRDKIKK
jgi:hypothetical protein